MKVMKENNKKLILLRKKKDKFHLIIMLRLAATKR